MRIPEPKRPGQDAEKNAAQFYKWMYGITEQLNMILEQLERGNVLDLQAEYGTAEQDGLLTGKVAWHDEQIGQTLRQQLQMDLLIAGIRQQLESQLLQAGSASIAYDTEDTVKSAVITFPAAYAEPPVVITNQIFSEKNIRVPEDKITTTGFTAQLDGAMPSAGVGSFAWLAIGRKEVT